MVLRVLTQITTVLRTFLFLDMQHNTRCVVPVHVVHHRVFEAEASPTSFAAMSKHINRS